MSRLSAFLHPVVTDETMDVIISARFRDEKGNPVPFKIRAITQEENDALTKKCSRVQKVQGRRQEYLDTRQLNRELVVAATVEPDFSSAEVCDAYGTKIPTQVPAKMLLAGEYDALLVAILELSGFDTGSTLGAEEDAKKLIGGADPDSEALIAYYCFINLGWPPSQYEALPYRERLLVAAMVRKEMASRPKTKNEGVS